MRDRKNPGSGQTLYLFFAFLILFALSFTLGVILGKRLGGSDNTQIAREQITIVPPDKTVTELEKETGAAIKEQTPEPYLAKEDAKTENAVIEDDTLVQDTTSSPTVSDEVPEQQPTVSEQPKEKTEAPTAKVEEQTPVISAIKEQTTENKSDTAHAEQKNLAALPKIDAGGKYTVQIGSFQEEDKAKQFAESLKSKGYPVFIKEVDIPGQGTRYRARVGTFNTRENAKLYGDNLKNREPGSVKLVYVTINN